MVKELYTPEHSLFEIPMQVFQTSISQEYPTISLDEPMDLSQTPVSQEQATVNLYDTLLNSYDIETSFPTLEEEKRDYIINNQADSISEPTVIIGEWRPFNLNEWQHLTVKELTFF